MAHTVAGLEGTGQKALWPIPGAYEVIKKGTIRVLPNLVPGCPATCRDTNKFLDAAPVSLYVKAF